MKYIITEGQNNLLKIRRRLNTDFDVIWEIIDEGIDSDLCRFDDFNEYFENVIDDSSTTYVFHYLEPGDEGFGDVVKFVSEFLRENFTTRITEYWENNKEDCE